MENDEEREITTGTYKQQNTLKSTYFVLLNSTLKDHLS